MATIIKFDLEDLRRLANDNNSCIIEKKVTQDLALQPWCLGNVKESVKNILDYKIGKFDKEFNGILLSYKNLHVLHNVGTIRNDNADVHFQVQADYFIFQPYIGATLRGVVNKKSSTHLGILVHRVFNVVVPRPTEEPGDGWIGERIQEGQPVIFRIVVLDLYGALPYIRGELDECDLDGEEQSEDLSVSYVNFDMTKPQKPIGASSPESSIEIKPVTANGHSNIDSPKKAPTKRKKESSKSKNNKKKTKSRTESDVIEPETKKAKKQSN